MCEICKDICKSIEQDFGHTVDPDKLAMLIESSPIKISKKLAKELQIDKHNKMFIVMNR